MNKAEFIDKIALETGLSKADSARSVDAYHKIVTEQLAKREDVVFVGFATYTTAERKARTGRNPQTGEVIQIPAAIVPKIKAGKALKEAVRNFEES